MTQLIAARPGQEQTHLIATQVSTGRSNWALDYRLVSVVGLVAAGGFLTLLLRPQWFTADAGVLGLSDLVIRTAAHLCVYGTLAVLLTHAIGRGRHVLLGWLMSVLLATAEEIHQLFVPYRFSCQRDWMLDLIGITCFILAYRWMIHRRH